MKLIDSIAKTNWKFIVIVVVLGLLVGGGVVWYRNLPTPEPQPIEISNIQKPTPQQTVDTSTWQTYRNEEFGFEVRYPNEWKIKNTQGTQLGFIFGCPKSENESFVGKDGTSKTGFGVCLFRVGTDFQKEALKEGEFAEFASRKEIILDGNTAIWQKLVDSDTPERPIYHVHMNTIVKGSQGTLILVGFNGDAIYSEEKFESILDQILATFRFVELNSYTCPETETLSCKPSGNTVDKRCNASYITWATKNCPNFRATK